MNHRYFFAIPPLVHLLDITGPAHIFYELKALGYSLDLYFLNLGLSSPSISSAGRDLCRNRWCVAPGS